MIRVSSETKALIDAVAADIQMATGKPVTMNDAIRHVIETNKQFEHIVDRMRELSASRRSDKRD